MQFRGVNHLALVCRDWPRGRTSIDVHAVMSWALRLESDAREEPMVEAPARTLSGSRTSSDPAGGGGEMTARINTNALFSRVLSLVCWAWSGVLVSSCSEQQLLLVAAPYERFMVGPKEPSYACGSVKDRPSAPALLVWAPRAWTADPLRAATDGIALEAMFQNMSYRVIAPAAVDGRGNASASVPLTPNLIEKLSAAPTTAIVATRRYGDKYGELALIKVDKEKLLSKIINCQ